LVINRLKLVAAALACSAIAASVAFVTFDEESADGNIAVGGDMLSPDWGTYAQPTVPTAQLGATAKFTPTTVDGAAPTTIGTTIATVASKDAATPAPTCRHWDGCQQQTMALHPTDHQ
jgi:hypothetical protein